MALAGRVLVAAAFVVWFAQPVGILAVVGLAYVLACAGSVCLIAARGGWMTPGVAVAFVATLLVGTGASLRGLAQAAPGAAYELVFYVVLPLVWVLIVLALDLPTVRIVIDLIPIVTFAVVVIGLGYWLYARGMSAMVWASWIPLGQGLGGSDYGLQMRFYPISTLLFVLPCLFWTSLEPRVHRWRISRWLAPAALLLGLAFMFVAGRRALFLSTGVAILAGLVTLLLQPRFRGALARRIAMAFGGGAVVMVVFAQITGFDVGALVNSIVGDASSDDDVRAVSMRALIDSWARAPFFGQGLGTEVIGSVRNEERPWEFEVQYHLGLHAFGLFGFVVLAAATCFVLLALVRMARDSRSPFALPVLSGAVAALVANATNPYLHTPGHYWMLFLAVALVNAVRREESAALRPRVRFELRRLRLGGVRQGHPMSPLRRPSR